MRSYCRILPLFLLLSLIGNKAAAQDGNALVTQIRQVNFVEPYSPFLSDIGDMILCMTNPGDDLDFANVCIECPPFSGNFHWVAQNIPIPPLGSDTAYVSVFINLDPCDTIPFGIFYEAGQYALQVSDSPLVNKPPVEPGQIGFFTSNPQPFYIESNPLGGSLELLVPNPFLVPIPELPWIPTIPPYEYKERACAIPNIDLDNSSHPPDADYAGDKNACVPTSTANSFMWLRDQHPELKTLLDSIFPTDSTRHRDMLEHISGVMMRMDCKGVFPDTFGRGKQAFVDNHNLPVSVKFQSVWYNHDLLSFNDSYGHSADNQNNSNNTIDMPWVFQELCDGEDVEMNYDCFWTDQNGNRAVNLCTGTSFDYSHSVVLSGAYKVSGNWGLSFKDDLEQDESGGMRHGFSWTQPDPTNNNRIFLDRFSGRTFHCILVDSMDNPVDTIVYTNRCFISTVMSESFDNSVTFDPVPCPPTLNITNDTLSSGIYQAQDTLCLTNVHVRGGQEVIFSAPVIKIDGNSTIELTSVAEFKQEGCP